MAATPKKTSSKSVTFSQEIADQTLLTAIEEELAEGHFSSFSELCKQALQLFLFEQESAYPPTENSDVNQALPQLQQQLTYLSQQMEQLDTRLQHPHNKDGSETVAEEMAILVQQSKQMAQQLTQLQRQLEDFDPTSNSSLDPKQFRQLEHQITYLTQQVDQIDGTTSQLVSQMGHFSSVPPHQSGLGQEQLGQIEDQITDLMGQVEQLGVKTDRFLTQLQEVVASSVLEGDIVEADIPELALKVERLERLEVRLATLLDRFEQSMVQQDVVSVGRSERRSSVATTPFIQVGFDGSETEIDRRPIVEKDPVLHHFRGVLEDF